MITMKAKFTTHGVDITIEGDTSSGDACGDAREFLAVVSVISSPPAILNVEKVEVSSESQI